jgi:putative oxidoreductase
MNPILGRFNAQIFAVLRIVTGLLFACHGGQKLLDFPPGGKAHPPIASLFGVSGVIELVGGLMIAAGLFATLAAFIASGEMAVAYFTAHATHGFWPIQNQGELAVVYCFLFLYIASHGSGIWSIDAAMGRGRTGSRRN